MTAVTARSGHVLDVPDDQVEFWVERGYRLAKAKQDKPKQSATKKAPAKSSK